MSDDRLPPAAALVPPEPIGRETPARDRTLVVGGVALVVAAGLLLTAVLAGPASHRWFTAVGGGLVLFVAWVAVTAAAHWMASARTAGRELKRARAVADWMRQEALRTGTEVVPAVANRVRSGEPVDAVLASVGLPADQSLQSLAWSVAQQTAEAEARVKAAASTASETVAEASRLTEEVLPDLVRRLRDERASAETALAGTDLPAEAALGRVVALVAEEIATSERRGAAAMAACASAAGRVQAQTTRLLAQLRELEERHSEDKVFPDLLELDHGMSQVGRLADNIALLSGGRTGRRWTKPIVMESVIRGAIGRIQDYRRVRLHSVTTVAVAGHAAEAVMHALAELIDNAATFSPPPSEVHVYVEEADVGVVVTIEDSGLGMRVHERQRAETAVSQPLDLATLTGTRLGHAVVGRLAARYGLTVSFRPSARGGTGVVVMIPRHLLSQPRQQKATPPAPPRRELPPERVGSEGLPKRPRGQTLARSSTAAAPGAQQPPGTGQPPGTQQPAVTEQPPVSRDSGQRFAAFRQTVRRDQPVSGEDEGHDDE